MCGRYQEMIAIKFVILFGAVAVIDGGELFENVYAKICYHFKHFCAVNPLLALSPVAFPAYPLVPGLSPIRPPLPPVAPPAVPVPPVLPPPPPLPLPAIPAPNSPFPLPVVPGCPPYIIVCPLGSISPPIPIPNIDVRLAAQIIIRTFNGCPCIDQRVGPALALGGLGGAIPAPAPLPGPLGVPPIGMQGVGQMGIARPPVPAGGAQQGGLPGAGGIPPGKLSFII